MTMDLNSTTQIAALYRAMKEIADGTTHDLTLRQLLVLLYVGSRTGPVTQSAVVDKQDQLKSTVSKIVAALAGTSGNVKRAEGMGMLSVDLDPMDMRSRLVSLSKDGERVLSRAVKALQPKAREI